MSKLAVTIDGYTFEVELGLPPAVQKVVTGCSRDEMDAETMTVMVDGQPAQVAAPGLNRAVVGDEVEWFIVDGRSYEVVVDADMRRLRSQGGIFSLEVKDLGVNAARPQTGDGRVKAPIPGLVTQVMIGVGDEVETGQPLLVLEAMKMQNEIRAPRSGVISSVEVAPGQGVTLHQLLVEISGSRL